jgi:hypothetical protein
MKEDAESEAFKREIDVHQFAASLAMRWTNARVGAEARSCVAAPTRVAGTRYDRGNPARRHRPFLRVLALRAVAHQPGISKAGIDTRSERKMVLTLGSTIPCVALSFRSAHSSYRKKTADCESSRRPALSGTSHIGQFRHHSSRRLRHSCRRSLPQGRRSVE